MSGFARAMWRRGRPIFIDGVASLVAKLRPDPRLFTVVTFHRVLPEERLAEYPLPEIAVTPAELDWILCQLRARYDAGPLAAQHARWLAGERGRPLLAITFDDGQRDNYLHARPVLEDLGLRASFFVVAKAIGGRRPLWHDRVGYGLAREPRSEPPLALIESMKSRPEAERAALADALDGAFPSWDGFMRWEELRAMAEAGHEIGSHSMSHALLPGCDDEALRVEIAESRRLLEARLGRDVETFCYPNGDWDARALMAVRAAGYRRAVTTMHGPNRPGCSAYALRRVDLVGAHLRSRRGHRSPARLFWRLSPLHPGPR